METLLDVTNLAADIGQFSILQDVSFAVPEHEITVLLGRNGAGKTTTLRTIMGYVPVKSGAVRFRGQSIAGVPTFRIHRKGIGYVPEDGNVFANLSIEENLRMSAKQKSTVFEQSLQRVLDIFPDLKAAWKRPAGALSGGQKQMLAMACVLVAQPPLMLIDEPTKGLSPLFVERLGDVLEQLRGQTTVLLVEQNFYLAQRVGDRFVLMDDGRTVAAGTMQELIASDDLQQRYLGVGVGAGVGGA